MPKILHLIDTGGPGGAETMFAQLVDRWPDSKDSVVTVISREGWLSSELRRRGIEFHIVDPKGSFNTRYVSQLLTLIRNQQIDVVVAHLFGSCVYGAIAGLLTRIRVIGVLHGQSDLASGERFRKLKTLVLRSGIDRLVFVSSELRETMADSLRLPADKMVVVSNGIDVNLYRPKNSDTSAFINIGAVGNIRRPKGYDILLRAASIVSKRLPNARFNIVGEGKGSLMDELLALRNRLGIDEVVEFSGFQPPGPRLYENLDIYVSSSTTEGFSLTCIEAMACGVPVVATRSGGPQGIIKHGETGLLVDVGNAEDLADAILDLAGDNSLRKKLAETARQGVINRFNIERSIDSYVSLCEEVWRE